MANYRTFHSQLSSIMETLTRAAVAEICELVDDGYAVLHLEISRHQKENEDLRQKLQLIESIIARGAVTDRTISGRESRLMREAARGKTVMVMEESCSGSRGFDESQPIAVEIKQEQPEAGETGDDERDGADMLSHDSLGEGEEVEEIPTEHEEDNGSGSSSSNPHTRTHALFHPDPTDATHTPHSLSLSQHTQRSLSHGTGDSELGHAILLESDDENTHADLTLDSIHTDSDTHTHSDAFSDTAQGPTDTAGPHSHTHADPLALDTHGDVDTADTHAAGVGGFMDRACVKPEVGVGVGVTMGVTELLSEWRTRSAHTHGHHSALSHVHTHGFPHTLTSSLRSGSPSSSASAVSSLFGAGVGLLSHTFRSHGHAHTHGHGQGHKRSFICAFCGKSFTTSQSLDTHTRIHTGERPFRCAQCGKRFTQSGHLTAHQTVHTGERPHPCTYCSKRFAGKQYLRIHMRKHHPDQQHPDQQQQG